MEVFLTVSGLFLFSFMVHVIIWKIQLPRLQTRALLMIFAVVFMAWIPFGKFAPAAFLHTALFYIAVSLCYVITYSAIEGDSPTLSLMMFVAQHSTEGVPESALVEFLVKRPFVKKRLDALLLDRLVSERDGYYSLAGQPSRFFRIILVFRKLYGPISRGG